jgi:Terminase small subunit
MSSAKPSHPSTGKPMRRVMTRLTVKQEAFCLAYLKTGNASEAYRQARGVETTDAGRAFCERARALLADLDRPRGMAGRTRRLQSKNAATKAAVDSGKLPPVHSK